jgi:Zn ribbon nucleic-acid-binding protein
MSDTLNEIAEAADLLTDSRRHAEPRYLDDDHGVASIPTKPYRTIVPGLIQQLRDASEPGSDGEQGGHGGPESVPVAIDAVSLLASISFGAHRRAVGWGIDVTRRPTAESQIRALVGVASKRTSDEQLELRGELRSWQWQAEIITGWRTPPKELLAPCPACDARGTLIAHPDPKNPTARCVGCGQHWSEDPREGEGHIGLLARHVIEYQDMGFEERREYRRLAVERRRRAEGKPPARAA